MDILRFILHYFLHFAFPAFIASWLYKTGWRKAYIIFLLTMLVDLDHLFAVPVFQHCRCSINFHPLHSYPAIVIYILMLLHRRTRIVALGLLMHMCTDGIDCLLSFYTCL
jgi:hypothetical protein